MKDKLFIIGIFIVITILAILGYISRHWDI